MMSKIVRVVSGHFLILMTCSLDMRLNSLENISTNHSYSHKLTREIHNKEIETKFKHKVGVSQIAPFLPPHSLREEHCLMLECWTPDRVVYAQAVTGVILGKDTLLSQCL